MGVKCCKKDNKVDQEDLYILKDSNDIKNESTMSKDKIKIIPNKEIAKYNNAKMDELIIGDNASEKPNPEKEFLKMLEDVPITERALRRKLMQLKPFDFESYMDASRLYMVKSTEYVNNELYFGFV